MGMTLSLLRYPGGKSRSAHKIASIITDKQVCSPFFGGGSVEFALAQKGTQVQAYDAFHSLVCFWKWAQQDPNKLANEVSKYFPLNPDDFRQLQGHLTEFDVDEVDTIDVATIFYVLNRASFSGSTLSGGSSPSHPRFNRQSIERLRNFSMKNITIERADFKVSIPLNDDKFLYCDPPYLLDKNASNLYGTKGNLHRFFDHETLRDLLTKRNGWLLSYNDCEAVRKMYSGFKIEPISWAYGMNKSKLSNEVLIRG